MLNPPSAKAPPVSSLDQPRATAPRRAEPALAEQLAFARGMRVRLGSLAAAALLAFGAPLAAQEASKPAPPRPGAAEGASEAARGVSDLGAATSLSAGPEGQAQAVSGGDSGGQQRQEVSVSFFGGEAEYRALLGAGQQVDYIVTAKADERLHVDVISETGDIVFEILKGEARLWSPEQGTVFGGALPEDGPWIVRLYGADAETESAFRLYLGLDAPAAPELPQDAAELSAEAVIDAAPLAAPEPDLALAVPETSAEPALETPAITATSQPGAARPELGVQLAQAESTTSTDATPPVLKIDVKPPTVPLLPSPDAPPFGAAVSEDAVPEPLNEETPAEPEAAQAEAAAPGDADAAPEVAAPASDAAGDATGGAASAARDPRPGAAASVAGSEAAMETAAPETAGRETGAAMLEQARAPSAEDASAEAATPVEPAAPAEAAAPTDAAAPAGAAAPAPPPARPGTAVEPAPAQAAAPIAGQGVPSGSVPPAIVVYYRAANLDGAMLNLRRGPSRSEPVVAQAGEGSLLVGSDCQMGGDLRWCRVSAVEDTAIWGWAAAQFLTVVEPPPAASGQ